MPEREHQKLTRKFEKLRVKKKQITEFPIYRQHPRRTSKSTTFLVESIDANASTWGIQMESMISLWCEKEIAEVQYISNQPRIDWASRTDDVTECGVMVAGGKLLAPYPLQKIVITENIFVRSAETEENSIMAIMKPELVENSSVSTKENKQTKKRAITIS